MGMTMIDMTVIKEIVGYAVVYVLLLVLAVVVGVVGKALNKWLAARAAAEEADKSLSEESEKGLFLSMVQDVIDGVVNAVGQTLVAGVKGTMAWTEEKKKEAFDMAYVGVADILSAADRVKLTAVFDDVEKWLTDSIEAAVLKNKDKWAESSAYNIFREKMEKFIKEVESEPAEVDESMGHPDPVGEPGEPGEPGVSAKEISDAAYEAATYEGAV